MLAAGIPAARVVAATGCTALAETIALTRQGVQSGCAACLVLPPFFFRDVSDEGLFVWYARLIEAVGDSRLRVLLYHIPQVTGVPISVDLVARLAAAFPGIIAGVKDSAGEWANTAALLARVPQLAILVGHEPHLPRALRAGGAGTICGVANAYPALVRALFAPSVTPADEERIATFIDIAFRQPFLPAFKSIVAARTRDPAWLALCPPQLPLDEGQRRSLLAALDQAGLPAGPGAGERPMSERTGRRAGRRHRRRRPRRAGGVRHADDLQRARAPVAGAAGPRLHDAALRVRVPAAEADRRLRAHGDDSLRAPAGSFRRGPAVAAGRLLPLHRRRPPAVDRRHPGPRRSPGRGAFWGEVQSAIHVGLGARGLVTNGSVRDLDQWAPGFQFLAGSIAPSHAYAKPVGFGDEVHVFGLRVRPGDILHADRHGAVVVPPTLVRAVPGAAAEIVAREARILAVARGPAAPPKSSLPSSGGSTRSTDQGRARAV